MKKPLLVILIAQLLFACGDKPDSQSPQVTNDAVTQPTTNTSDSSVVQQTAAFDINAIPISTSDVGDFPFFTLPKGLSNQNEPLIKNFDVCFFPIDGVMTPIEGKLFKTNVVGDGSEEFSQRYYEKSLEDYLLSLGAVKVFDGHISDAEYQRYHAQDPNKGKDGDIGYSDQLIKVYVLRTADKNIYIQFTANSAAGKLNILEQQALNQTVTKITSDKIADDLQNTGKSVLHINFDTNKATLKADGQAVVAEIVKALEQNTELKIAINGHTDNVGNRDHNQKLSQDRADAVKSELVKAGIAADRLTAQGFGQDNPIVSNDSEANKAQNRRVELVKL